MEYPNALSPELWCLFLEFNFTALEQKCWPICIGFTMHRRLVAATVSERRPCITELNTSEDQYGGGVSVEVGKVCLRSTAVHQTSDWAILVDCSNNFKYVMREEIFEEVLHRIPILALFFVVKYHGDQGDI